MAIGYKAAKEGNFDIVFWNHINFDDVVGKCLPPLRQNLFAIAPLEEGVISGIPEIAMNYLGISPWLKMCKLAFIREKGLEYQNLSNSNDVYFGYMIILLAQRVLYLDIPLVYHRVNRRGQISSNRGCNPFCAYYALMKINDSIERKNLVELKKVFRGRVLGVIYYAFIAKGSSIKSRNIFSHFLQKQGCRNLGIESCVETDFISPVDYAEWKRTMDYINNLQLLNAPRENLFIKLLKDEHIDVIKQEKLKCCLWGFGDRGRFFYKRLNKICWS